MKNLILMNIDNLRKDVVGIYNNEENLTPFLDSLSTAPLMSVHRIRLLSYLELF